MEFLLLLAILPSVVIARIIYQADRQEKEPKKELFKAFCFGVLSIMLTLFVSFFMGITVLSEDASIVDIMIYSFISVALIEEVSKWLCSYLFLRKNKNFNYLFDGIVYFVFVALGFATVENILYTLSGGILVGVVRAITTVPAHTFFAIFGGYYFAIGKKEKLSGDINLSKKYYFYSLLIPVLLHGFYDFCLLSGEIIFYILYFVFVVFLYIVSVKRVKLLMKMEAPFELKMIYCMNCGNKIQDKPCCTYCGNKVNKE